MNVGFIGLGNMGNPMAANILKAQYNLTIYDLRREMGQPLEAAGATWATSPKSAAAQSDVVLTSLPGPKEVEAVVLGEDGIFAGLNSGGAYIDLSTNSPTTLQKIAEIGTSRGFHVLDAPISGGVFGARDGTLTIFVGGEQTDFERFQPLFQSIGDHVAYMGPVGSGHVTKLVNNFIMFINFAGVCEGMAMGVKAGIHPQALLDVIKTSTGDSMYLRRTIGLLLAGEDVNSAADLAVKDVHLAVELGKELDIPIELGPLVEDIFKRFCDQGRGQEDQLEIMRDFMRRSGVEVPERKSS